MSRRTFRDERVQNASRIGVRRRPQWEL
jgi:hypothetical protein